MYVPTDVDGLFKDKSGAVVNLKHSELDSYRAARAKYKKQLAVEASVEEMRSAVDEFRSELTELKELIKKVLKDV